jgi:hypothetical protein
MNAFSAAPDLAEEAFKECIGFVDDFDLSWIKEEDRPDFFIPFYDVPTKLLAFTDGSIMLVRESSKDESIPNIAITTIERLITNSNTLEIMKQSSPYFKEAFEDTMALIRKELANE